MRFRVLLLAFVIGATACANNTPPPPGFGDTGPLRDAAIDAPLADVPTVDSAIDVPSIDAGDDAGGDAGEDAEVDSGMDDAGMDDAGSDAGMDSGAPTPTIDGELAAGEWDATAVTNSEATLWTGNELRSLRAFTDGSDLWVAIEGIVEGTPATEVNAIVMYVDADLSDTTTGVLDPIDLTDGSGALDDSISAGYRTDPPFRADFAFGTRGMNESAEGTDARIGWRDIASDPNDFAWISGDDAPAVCGTDACETRIPLATLGAVSGNTIAMFVRINDGTGMSFNNAQCLPEDNPSDTTTVTSYYTVDVP